MGSFLCALHIQPFSSSTQEMQSQISAEEKHRYLDFNYVFYASVIKMSVSDAHVLELNYQKIKNQTLKVFAEKLPSLKK